VFPSPADTKPTKDSIHPTIGQYPVIRSADRDTTTDTRRIVDPGSDNGTSIDAQSKMLDGER